MLNDSDKILISTCQEISIDKLLHNFKQIYKHVFLRSVISIFNEKLETITTTQNIGGERIWFKCPKCKNRVVKIYKRYDNLDLGCRKCLKLEYKSRM